MLCRQRHAGAGQCGGVQAGAQAHGGFLNYTLELSQQHHQELLAQPLDAATDAKLVNSVQTSLLQLQQLEALPQDRFEEYVARYYA